MKKVIVITGASDGIGAEMARQLAAQHGSDVALVLAARNEEKLGQVAEAVGKAGAEATIIPTDVTDRDACSNLIDKTIDAHTQLDILVQNAGMSAHANFADISEEDLAWYQDLMTLNFWSTVWLTKDALPHLIKSKGQIVAVSSVAGLVGVPGRSAYCATKWAMGGFFDSLRPELAHQDVAVTIAHPGVVATAIRERGYAAGGEPLGRSGIREDKVMSVEECASRIIKGMETRKREIIMTRQTHLGRWLKLLAPSLIDKIAMNEVKPEFRPDQPR
ncbi:MAG: SDR family oxidoreductase [Pseudomonadota bacterium]